LRTKTVDLLVHVENELGFRLGLNNLAGATLGVGKTGDGKDSVRWYREGQIQKVLDYCYQDVRVTKDLYEYGSTHKRVCYQDRFGRKKERFYYENLVNRKIKRNPLLIKK